MDTQQSITFQGVGGTSSGNSIGLYQEELENDTKYPSYADIHLMMAYANNGVSAFSALQDNPYAKINGDNVDITLEFYTQPYPTDLLYSLSTNGGSIGGKEILQKEYTRSMVVPMVDSLIFPTNVSVLSLQWLTPVYTDLGEQTSIPSYQVSDNKIIFNKTIFAVVRLNYVLTEHKYLFQLSIPKTETENIQGVTTTNDYSITGLTPVITGTFLDKDGKPQVETLTLEYPQIISDYLESCPEKEGGLVIDWGSIDWTNHVTYYYSTCDGEILHTKRT